ncbi:SDR family oxidoreductase [Mucilaginibacter corticis]|uniref:SDR family oxidoreductase n=1 Tax=Mucilaginibacter corticis TaxID=2597670 RepID=A0A556M9E6_9SPHI|nr:SDR family oxidoreductase [Mucilaginibacter corticis]TSJ36523.1 SDR family oxidoreductase [Mucilaginibacter corticis]
MKKHKDKVAVITGGNSGIGYGIAKELIAQGAEVVITGRSQNAVKEAEQTLGPGTTGIVADQSNIADLSQLADQIKKQFGHVDMLVIKAGIMYMSSIEETTEAQFDEIMDVNFKGAFFTLQKFLPLMESGASVIFILALSATQGTQNRSVYSASKAALKSLARVAAIELAPKGIRVNAISPGPFSTPIFGKSGAPAAALEKFADTISQKVLLKRYGEPGEIGKLVSFLSSQDASYITGGDYVIDGGMSINVS